MTLSEAMMLAARLHACCLLNNDERVLKRAAVCLEQVEFDVLLLDPHIAPYIDHEGTLRLHGIEITTRRPLTDFRSYPRRVPPVPPGAKTIPGRLGHAEWCPAATAPSCICGANEPAFDAFGQPKPGRPVELPR